MPRPDPTKLTDAAITRSTAQYRQELAALREVLETRMNGMDTARRQYLATLAKELGDLGRQILAARNASEQDHGRMQLQLDQRLDSLKQLLDERYAAQTRAFEEARATALESVRAALAAAETAVNKAEIATEKRFESVNEFRQSLADQTSGFMTRDEVGVRIDSITGAASRNAELLAALELRLTSRLDTLSAAGVATKETRTEQRLSQNAIVSIIVAVIVAVGVLVSVLTFAHK